MPTHMQIARLVQKADDARKKREFNEAAALFEQVLENNPSHIKALLGLGYLFLELNEYQRAISYFERVLNRVPDNGRALYGAAVAHVELEQYEQAASYAFQLEALGNRESKLSAHQILGQVAFGQGQFEGAAEQLEQGLKPRRRGRRGWKTHKRLRFLLAQSYLELNRLADAARQLERLLTARWSRATQDQLGHLYLELERIEDAQTAFLEIINRHPDDLRALEGLGRTHLAGHDHQEAIKVFKEILSQDSNNLQALDGMAEAYKEAGDLNQAYGYVERLRRVYRLPPAQLDRRIRSLERERQRRDAELLRVRNIAALNVMATGIAHELRQPLSVIRLAAQNARRDLAGGDVSLLDEDLKDIDDNVVKIDRIVGILRDISSAESSEVRPVRLDQVVDRALTLFRTQLRNRNIELKLRNLETMILADPVALEQVLINLLSNARDALMDSSSRAISIWTVQGKGRTWLYFKDTGKGMSPEVRRRALEPFYTTKEGKGTGLGLSVSFSLMRRMGGQIAIKESSPEKGTTLELILQRGSEYEEPTSQDPGS